MHEITYKPQQTHPDHPLVLERRRRQRAEQSEEELITIAFIMSVLLCAVTGVLLIVTGCM